MTTYIVAATPRSGGSLLCETLADTGVAGAPAEFFEPSRWFPAYARELGFPSADAARANLPGYVARLRARFATANGALGVKLHWDQVAWLATLGTSPAALLGPCRFLYITRGDVTRQAISLVRAKQTGVWRSGQSPSGRSVFDPVAIRDMVFWLVQQNAGWESFFASRADEPLRLAYETFVPERTALVPTILAFLGIAFDPTAVERRLATTSPRLAQQADETSAAWLRLYSAYLATLP